MKKLCTDCRRVLSQIFTTVKPSRGESNPTYEHLRHAADLVASAEDCRLCDSVLENLRLILDYSTPPNLDNSQVLLLEYYRERPIYFELAGDDPFPYVTSAIGCRWTRLYAKVRLADSEEVGLRSAFYLFARPESVASMRRDIIGKQPLDNSGNHESLELLNSWYKCCLTTHTNCLPTFPKGQMGMSQTPCLPTRVLDVGSADSSQQPRLYEADGSRAHYVTLSHCWGRSKKKNLCTTRSNVEEHFQRIDPKHLSRTYRDCIAATKAIGLRYLWIDSLCIVQDDPEDWEAEAQKMGSYYQLSSLTVAAAAVEIDSDGLFQPRSAPDDAIEVPYLERNGRELGSFFVAPQPNGYGNVGQSALRRRAWAAQEWLLSRRMIHYQGSTLTWHCNELYHTDIGLSYLWPHQDIAYWSTVVETYSGLDISFDQDRLIAIQGLANLLKQTRNDTYLFGLWTGDLPEQLFWTKFNNLITNTALPYVPSWSWASKIGQVNVFWQTRSFRDWIPVASLVSFEDSGALSLTGHLLLVSGLQYKNLAQTWPNCRPEFYDKPFGINWGIALDDSTLPERPPTDKIILLESGGQSDTTIGWIVLDLDDRVQDTLHFFLLATTSKEQVKSCDSEHHLGYALEQSDMDNTSSKRARDIADPPHCDDGCAVTEYALCQVLILQPSPSNPGAFERIGVGHVGDYFYQTFLDVGKKNILLV